MRCKYFNQSPRICTVISGIQSFKLQRTRHSIKRDYFRRNITRIRNCLHERSLTNSWTANEKNVESSLISSFIGYKNINQLLLRQVHLVKAFIKNLLEFLFWNRFSIFICRSDSGKIIQFLFCLMFGRIWIAKHWFKCSLCIRHVSFLAQRILKHLLLPRIEQNVLTSIIPVIFSATKLI